MFSQSDFLPFLNNKQKMKLLSTVTRSMTDQEILSTISRAKRRFPRPVFPDIGTQEKRNSIMVDAFSSSFISDARRLIGVYRSIFTHGPLATGLHSSGRASAEKRITSVVGLTHRLVEMLYFSSLPPPFALDARKLDQKHFANYSSKDKRKNTHHLDSALRDDAHERESNFMMQSVLSVISFPCFSSIVGKKHLALLILLKTYFSRDFSLPSIKCE